APRLRDRGLRAPGRRGPPVASELARGRQRARAPSPRRPAIRALPPDAPPPPRGDREERLADRRGVPDAEPDPPPARAPHEARARARGRPRPPPPRGRDEGRRRARGRALQGLRDAPRPLLPEEPHTSRRLPGRDALRGPARGPLPRARQEELRHHALHR